MIRYDLEKTDQYLLTQQLVDISHACIRSNSRITSLDHGVDCLEVEIDGVIQDKNDIDIDTRTKQFQYGALKELIKVDLFPSYVEITMLEFMVEKLPSIRTVRLSDDLFILNHYDSVSEEEIEAVEERYQQYGKLENLLIKLMKENKCHMLKH